MTVRTEIFKDLVAFVRTIYGQDYVPLHRPVFVGNERAYLVDCIDSNFVSSVGARVTQFENQVAEFMGARYGIATVNGTAALQVALQLAGVRAGDEVLSQALTFIATCNAISYAGAKPVFVDVDRETLGMCPDALRRWLTSNAQVREGQCFNRATGARIAACVPMHTFGLPCRMAEIVEVCAEFGIALIEDSAESLGSYIGDRHTGRFGSMATLSFNGNKVITTGGGGMIVTDDEEIARRAKHLTTTAKVPHAWEFMHDEIGYNFRLPNLNAALGCAQIEMLPQMLAIKGEVAEGYAAFCPSIGLPLVRPRSGVTTNNWLNAILLDSRAERDALLEHTNGQGVMTRPVWRLMNTLPMFAHCEHDGLANSRWLEERLVNLPSSVPDADIARLSI